MHKLISTKFILAIIIALASLISAAFFISQSESKNSILVPVLANCKESSLLGVSKFGERISYQYFDFQAKPRSHEYLDGAIKLQSNKLNESELLEIANYVYADCYPFNSTTGKVNVEASFDTIDSKVKLIQDEFNGQNIFINFQKDEYTIYYNNPDQDLNK